MERKRPMAEMKTNSSFEEKLKRIEEIVEKVEGNALPLEETLSYFKEGSALVKECEEILKEAKSKVNTVNKVTK